MKRFILILICLPFIGFTQDNIILKDGNEIAAKIIEINIDDIKYKRYTNLEGPLYTKNIDDVFMIKYENGEKDVFERKHVDNKEGTEKYILRGGDLIPLIFKQSISSKDMSNGSLVKFAVKQDIVSDKNKIIIKANTTVNGRISRVKKAAWAGQKGKIDIQINSIKGVDGTNIPVYYNLNNEGKSRQAAAIGIGVVLFWPALFVKGKQATIDAGTVIMVETMADVTFNTYNFEKKEIVAPRITNEDPLQKESIESEVVQKPKAKDFKSSLDYQKALRKYYKSIEEK